MFEYKHTSTTSELLKIKSDFGARTIEGLASTFGNVDDYGDVIEPGAFKRTLKRRKGRIVHLWQHNADDPIGKPLVLEESDQGLRFKSRISEVPNGDKALTLHADKVIRGISIGFMLKRKDYKLHEPGDIEDGRLRTIKRVHELWEYSSVTFPANNMAAVTSVMKSLDPATAVALWAREQANLGTEAFSKASLEKLEAVAVALLDIVNSSTEDTDESKQAEDLDAFALALQFGCMDLSNDIRSLGRTITG